MFKFDELGQEIINELSHLIQEDVILTDSRGFIQVSTDPTRINQFHEGALLSLKEERLILMSDEEVARLKGVRKGIVIPIIIEDHPIAVIGITGEPEKIRPQALLIRRVVELFIQDALKRKEKEEKIREFEFFMIEWITSNTKDKQFYNRAEVLGIEVAFYKQIAILQVEENQYRFSTEDVEFLLSVQGIHPKVIISRWGQDKLVVVIPMLDQVFLRQEMENLLLHMKRKTKILLAAGIGDLIDNQELMISFNQAERAAKVSQKQGRVIFERELLFDLILHSLPKETRDRYIQRTVHPLHEEPELLHNLRVWFGENQSMKNTAEKLHIHKNTLTYRLQKVEDLTGLSISKIHDLFLIYLGVRLLEEYGED